MGCSVSSKPVKACHSWSIVWFSVTDTEKHQILKSNTSIMQTEIMKEYIFYQVGVIVLYSSFQ